ncbi:hypothetical protein D516_2936 [Rhodobacter sp. AKP1]|nr:hypothetical protein D516_2936 [Rhodobacter sp. AKP1]
MTHYVTSFVRYCQTNRRVGSSRQSLSLSVNKAVGDNTVARLFSPGCFGACSRSPSGFGTAALPRQAKARSVRRCC